MQRFGPLPDLVDTIDEGERFFMLESVIMLARATDQRGIVGLKEALAIITEWGEPQAKPPITQAHMRSLEWDEMLLMVNPWYDSFVAASRRKTFKARTEALAAHDHRAMEFGARVNKYL